MNFTKKHSELQGLIGVFTHLKLCHAEAIHNFKVSENDSDSTK